MGRTGFAKAVAAILLPAALAACAPSPQEAEPPAPTQTAAPTPPVASAPQTPFERVQETLGIGPSAGAPAAAGDEPSTAEPAAPGEPGAASAPSELLDLELEGPLLSARTWKRLGRDLGENLIAFLPALVRALIVLVVFFLIYRALRGILGGVMRRANAEPAVRDIALKLLRYALVGLGAVMALAQLGFDVGSMLAGLGIVGLAVGLAAQETLANLIAGLTLLWDRPFRIGDNVTIAGTFGQVKQIGLRATRIMTVDRLDAIIPNKEILDHQIINHTATPQLRLAVPLGIAYREDSRRAREVLVGAVTGHRLILEEPEPAVVVTGLGDSSVNLELRVWLRDPYTERDALFEMTEIAKIALDEAGIEIPFPQRTLHFPKAVEVDLAGAPATVAPEAAGTAGEDGEERG